MYDNQKVKIVHVSLIWLDIDLIASLWSGVSKSNSSEADFRWISVLYIQDSDRVRFTFLFGLTEHLSFFIDQVRGPGAVYNFLVSLFM
jgi:hypothetical protein